MIDYLTKDQMSFMQIVSRRNCKNALGQMFTIETALIKKH